MSASRPPTRQRRRATGATPAHGRGAPACELEGAQARIGGASSGATSTSRSRRASSRRSSDRTAPARRRCCASCSASLPLARGDARGARTRAGAQKGQIGYLPQRRHFDAAPGFAASTSCGSGSTARAGDCRCGAPERERVEEVIELVGASAYAQRPIGRLSGGEQQRLLIAQALVSRPRAADPRRAARQPRPAQPDARSRRCSSGSAASSSVTVLLVAHDVNPLLAYLDRVVYFGAGRAVVGTPARGHHGADAQPPLRRAGRGAARRPTGGSSSSACPRRPPTTATAMSITEHR